jgi:hypothetical protein
MYLWYYTFEFGLEQQSWEYVLMEEPIVFLMRCLRWPVMKTMKAPEIGYYFLAPFVV